MKLLFKTVIFLFVNNTYAQSAIFTERYYCSGKRIDKCKEDAIKSLKTKALRESGVSEDIKSYKSISRSQSNNEFESYVNSNILTSIGGYVQNIEFLEEVKNYDPIKEQMYFELKIRAKIKKYKSVKDPQFVARVEGLLETYKSNDEGDFDKNIKLKITPQSNCYIKVFYINDSEAQICYPIETEENVKTYEVFDNKMHEAGKSFNVNYISPETKKESEFGNLLIVITKKDYPYIYSTPDENGLYVNTFADKIFDWYLSIEPENKNIIYKSFSINR
ncbi:MAG: hypothetical protein CL827_00900 [Crocinitomicaceae bacterium]|nr:hypothetical protein [Crocinitomicaceae bacterium]